MSLKSAQKLVAKIEADRIQRGIAAPRPDVNKKSAQRSSWRRRPSRRSDGLYC